MRAYTKRAAVDGRAGEARATFLEMIPIVGASSWYSIHIGSHEIEVQYRYSIALNRGAVYILGDDPNLRRVLVVEYTYWITSNRGTVYILDHIQ